jgi:hypothetical protein
MEPFKVFALKLELFTLVALVEDHSNVVLDPSVMVVGDNVKVTVGAGVVVPPPPHPAMNIIVIKASTRIILLPILMELLLIPLIIIR